MHDQYSIKGSFFDQEKLFGYFGNVKDNSLRFYGHSLTEC